MISKGLVRGLDEAAVGRGLILNIKANVDNALITDNACMSTRVVALVFSFSARAKRPDSLTSSCLSQTILICSELT